MGHMTEIPDELAAVMREAEERKLLLDRRVAFNEDGERLVWRDSDREKLL